MGPSLATGSPSPSKSTTRENYAKCLFRVPSRFNAAGLLGTAKHAGEILSPAGALFSHPLVSASLVLRERKRIFSHVETRWRAGLGLLFTGGLLYWFGRRHFISLSENDRLAIAIFSVVVVWAGGFVLCYGVRALRTGVFPMLFLLLMVPTPDFVLDRVIYWLQACSAEVSYAAFELMDVPVLRSGFIFWLPGVTVEVAKECSGIRSSLVLAIMSLLAGHPFLRSVWTKAVLTLATLPLLIVKNGIRIVTLSLLSI